MSLFLSNIFLNFTLLKVLILKLKTMKRILILFYLPFITLAQTPLVPGTSAQTLRHNGTDSTS